MSDLRDWVAARAAHDLLRHRLIRTVLVPTPSAGADWSVTVPGGVVWEPLSISTRFATSAVVATRFPQFRLRDQDSNQRWIVGNQFSQAASLTWTWTLAPYVTTYTGSGFSAPIFAMPVLPWLPAWTLSTSTGSLDVGDQWSQLVLTVIEWSAAQVGQHLEKILGDELFATYADREV